MKVKKTYTCEECEKTVAMDSQNPRIPECCGLPMKEEISVCTTTDTAEHARFSEKGEPCDDGRAG